MHIKLPTDNWEKVLQKLNKHIEKNEEAVYENRILFTFQIENSLKRIVWEKSDWQ